VGASIIDQIRQAVEAGRVRMTDHALDELVNERFHVIDAESALVTGRIVRTQTAKADSPGPRYTVVGKATDLSTELAIVCRFESDDRVLVITAYPMRSRDDGRLQGPSM